jgi:hypothetical protein
VSVVSFFFSSNACVYVGVCLRVIDRLIGPVCDQRMGRSDTHTRNPPPPYTHTHAPQPVKVAEVGDYDVRYLSFSTADGVLPQPVIQTIDGVFLFLGVGCLLCDCMYIVYICMCVW